jgi:hypothetical protein
MRNVVIKGRGYDKIFHNQIAVQGPDELVGLAGFWLGFTEASIGAFDERMVVFDRFRDSGHFGLFDAGVWEELLRFGHFFSISVPNGRLVAWLCQFVSVKFDVQHWFGSA